MNDTPISRLIDKLQIGSKLNPQEMAELLLLPLEVKRIDSQQDVVFDGQKTNHSVLLLDGFLFRYKIVGEGNRQILSLHIPGEIPDLQSLHLKLMDHSLASAGPATIAEIQHHDLIRLFQSQPRVGLLLWRETLIDAGMFREWIANIGARPTRQRMAHLLCEFIYRVNAVNLNCDNKFAFPFNQSHLADALGVSLVHTNRTLQELRGENLLEIQHNVLTLLNWERMQAEADFDPAYLHLDHPRGPLTLN